VRYIVVDLEATCWMKRVPPERIETIAVGAVALASENGPAEDEFASLVRPINESRLSGFCMGLTGIRQREIDAADNFAAVFPRFLRWIGRRPHRLCSWSRFDLLQFRADCVRHGLPMPREFARHIDLEHAFAEIKGTRPTGVKDAMKAWGLKPSGRAHRALDDARNIAQLAMTRLLPVIASRTLRRRDTPQSAEF
jgi:inhibitor of KinA sporulation pathway (predicted exonuclease)